jgi:hypothetical protein
MFGYVGGQILILAWIPVVLVVFMLLPARRAMVASAVTGWLLLPPLGIALAGLPDYTKTGAAGLSILLATIIFEPARLLTFRPRWFDLPMVVFCLCPFITSTTNDLGAYDGIAAVFTQCVNWLLPYAIGRLYLTDFASFRELGLGMIIGGLCLIPLCLVEIKMSPILQPMLYGIGKWEGTRYQGFRPRIFFETGLELGLWMNAVALVAWWFWRTSQFKQLWGIPSSVIFALLLVIAIMCRSTGATFLLAFAFLVLVISLRTRTKWALWGLLCIAPLFYTVRITNLWSGQSAVELMKLISEARADSLDYRFENDDMLIAKAMQKPFFGWGGWGRNRVYDKSGRDVAVTDGFWILIFGSNGCVGLISMTLAMLLPVALVLARFPIERWNQPSLAPVAVFVTILAIFSIDCLMNAMPNVIYVIAAGGLFNFASTRTKAGKSGHDDNDNATLVARSWETLAAQYRARGRASKDQGRLIEAKTAWLHALDFYTKLTVTQPGRPGPHQQWCDCANDLAWLLANAADPVVNDPACALSLAIKTTEAYPECGTYWNTLGAAYYRTGDFKAASAALDRSITLGEGGATFDYIFLTMTHAQLGHQEQAHHWFAKAMHSIEQHHSDHPELSHFCAEAKSLLSRVPETSATAD